MSLQKYSLGISYTILLVLVGGVANYFTWSPDAEMTASFLWLFAAAILLMYLPFLFFTQFRDWKIKEFGFVVNGATIGTAVLLIAVAVFIALAGTGTDFQTALIEAVARTGEELLFRSFVYALTLRILAGRKDNGSLCGLFLFPV